MAKPFVDQREAAEVLQARASEVLALLLADGVDLIRLSSRRWRVSRSAWQEWLTQTAPSKSRKAIELSEKRKSLARLAIAVRDGSDLPEFLRS